MSKRVTMTNLGKAQSVRWDPALKTIAFELDRAQTQKLAAALAVYASKGYGTLLWAAKGRPSANNMNAYVSAVT